MNLVQSTQIRQPAPEWWSPLLNVDLGESRYNSSDRVSLEAGSVLQNRMEAAEHYAQPISRDIASPEHRFRTLAARWQQSVKHLSSATAMAMHPAYQEIVGMGPIVVPYILQELGRRPDHWFWALRVITGVDPVPSEKRGRVNEMVECWLDWGRLHGYLWAW